MILASLPVEIATRQRGTSVGGSGVDNVVAGCGRWGMGAMVITAVGINVLTGCVV